MFVLHKSRSVFIVIKLLALSDMIDKHPDFILAELYLVQNRIFSMILFVMQILKLFLPIKFLKFLFEPIIEI